MRVQSQESGLSMNPGGSPYYPRRAPWYAPLREGICALLAATRLNRLRPPASLGWHQFLGGLLLPGFGFAVYRRPGFGRWVALGWVAVLLVGLAGLGQSWAVPIFGLLIGLHATSLLHLLTPWLTDCRPGYRLALSVLSVGALVTLVYLPAERLMERLFCLPLAVDGRVIIVRPGGDPATVRQGEWVAWRLDPYVRAGLVIHGGLELTTVLGVAGDLIEFAPGSFRVNGVKQPSLPDMPAEGTLQVPGDFFFLWPQLATLREMNMPRERIEAARLDIAIVPRSQFVGRPYGHWFFRRQHLP